MRRTIFISFLVLVGCANTSDLEDPEQVRAWANSASALAAFLPAHEPLAFAENGRVPDDPSCPVIEDDGTTLTVTGDCTDTSDVEWRGLATVLRTTEGGYDVTLDGYGHGDDDPAVVTGTITVAPAGAGWSFDADFRQEGLTTVEVDYEGTLEGDSEGPTTWSGEGTITRGGFTDASGTSTARTEAQRRDPSCSNQSWSGSTTIEHEGRTLVVTYDGETDCDDDAAARYSLDGEDRGTVDGVSCSATPGRGAPWLALSLLGVVGLWLYRRR